MDFEKLCEKNYDAIFRYTLGMTGEWEAAQDLTQEVFLVAYKKGTAFLQHEKPEAFLYRTAKNLVQAYYRKKKREIAKGTEIEPEGYAPDAFEQLCRKREDAVNVERYRQKVLENLSEEGRILYQSYYIKRQSMREIATARGISETAVRMRFVRLRKEIKQYIKKFRLGDF